MDTGTRVEEGGDVGLTHREEFSCIDMAWEGVELPLVPAVVAVERSVVQYRTAWQAQAQKMTWVERKGVQYHLSAEMLVTFPDMQKSSLGKSVARVGLGSVGCQQIFGSHPPSPRARVYLSTKLCLLRVLRDCRITE
jgi:hypothetical protein